MKDSLFNFMIVFFFIMSPALAMIETEEPSKHTSMTLSQQKTSEEKNLPSDIVTIESLLDDMFLCVFKFVEIPDLGRFAQVSNRWKRVAEAPALWKYMGSQYYGDYLSEEDLKENLKQKVVDHYLSVMVNAAENLGEMGRIVRHYKLYLFSPLFKTYLPVTVLLEDLVTAFSDREELVAQCNFIACNKKIKSLSEKLTVTLEDAIAARNLNEMLIEIGDQKAINRKFAILMEGPIRLEISNKRYDGSGGIISAELWHPSRGYSFIFDNSPPTSTAYVTYGYEKNPIAAREFNDSLVEKGNQKAIKRKIEGLMKGEFGYEKSPEEAREFNELLVATGDMEALKRKIKGLGEKEYGYKEDLIAARELTERLIDEGDQWAISIKHQCLYYGAWGYKKDPEEARAFLEMLIEKGNPQAIHNKVVYLTTGKFGYEKDLMAARKFNNFFIDQGDWRSLLRKSEGLYIGRYGYGKSRTSAREFNDSLVEKGNPWFIRLKLEGLLKGENAYEKDPIAAREFIENLVFSEAPMARGIGKYLKAFALKYGVSELGYKKDREKAFKFIRENQVPY